MKHAGQEQQDRVKLGSSRPHHQESPTMGTGIFDIFNWGVFSAEMS